MAQGTYRRSRRQTYQPTLREKISRAIDGSAQYIGALVVIVIAVALVAWKFGALSLLAPQVAQPATQPPAVIVRPTAPPVIRPAIIVPGAPPAAEGQPTPLPLVAPATDSAPAVYVAPAVINDERREQLNSVEAPAQCVNCQQAQPAAPVVEQPVMSGRMSSGVVEVAQPTPAPALVQPTQELHRRQLTFDGKGSSQK